MNAIALNPEGEVWRIVNASGSRSYDLSLTNDATGAALPLQILAVDGVAIENKAGSDLVGLRTLLGGKAKPTRCGGNEGDEAICTSSIRMMPSARVEVRVIRRDTAAGTLTATFRTDHFSTGATGDDWPSVALAQVSMPAPRSHALLAVLGQARRTLSAGSADAAFDVFRPAKVALTQF